MASDDQMWTPRTPTIGMVTPDPVPHEPFVEIGEPGWRIIEWRITDGSRPLRLHPDDIEAIARRVAELLRGAT